MWCKRNEQKIARTVIIVSYKWSLHTHTHIKLDTNRPVDCASKCSKFYCSVSLSSNALNAFSFSQMDLMRWLFCVIAFIFFASSSFLYLFCCVFSHAYKKKTLNKHAWTVCSDRILTMFWCQHSIDFTTI